MTQKKAEHIEFEQLVRSSRRILYSVCLAFTDRKPDSINDLYMEIVANLWHSWPKFHNESSPATWVYRIALNTAGMELRKRRRWGWLKTYPMDESFVASLAEDPDPRIEELYELIDLLPDEEKKLLFLYLDHLSYAQIAQIAGTSENAVKQHIYRIRQKLIQLHKQEYDR